MGAGAENLGGFLRILPATQVETWWRQSPSDSLLPGLKDGMGGAADKPIWSSLASGTWSTQGRRPGPLKPPHRAVSPSLTTGLPASSPARALRHLGCSIPMSGRWVNIWLLSWAFLERAMFQVGSCAGGEREKRKAKFWGPCCQAGHLGLLSCSHWKWREEILLSFQGSWSDRKAEREQSQMGNLASQCPHP